MTKSSIKLFLFCSLFTIISCGPHYNYRVRIRSQMNENIYDAVASFDGFSSEVGVIIPNTGKGYCCVRIPVPDTVVVSWRLTNNQKHEIVVEVAQYLPPEFNLGNDAILFTIMSDNSVMLSFEISTGKFTSKEIFPDMSEKTDHHN